MKKCKNCNAIIREEDKYCRNCGVVIPSKLYNIVCDIYTVLIVLGILFFIVLIVASYIID